MVCLLGRFPALAGADLDVTAGEVVLVSGPNGAGKTTLLRLVAGLVAPYSGSVEVLGIDLVADRRSARRNLALVGHETYCYDDLTATENVEFFARASGRGDTDVAAALDRVALTDAANVVHRGLSAGQRRRLALAVALVRAPSLLLLDEPHAGLDALGREVLAEVIREAPAEGRTVVMVSHELEIARPLVSREVRVEGGQVWPVASDARAPVSEQLQ
ncbi:MAG: heme ABC exporter ATP-binding protein CcmA [Acidimicrobiia bacterium]|nr:heme ABC exporter ATP-binding protein CcmA [Acidimicrobiia bacterium]